MASTEERARRNEVRLPKGGGGAQITGGGAPPANPTLPAPGAPQNLRLIDPVLLFSTVEPRAGVTAVWQAPGGVAPDDYLVQYATAADFADAGARTTARRGETQLALDNLPVDADVYVRVAGRSSKVQGPWSNTATIHTPSDTTPPDPVTDGAAAFAVDGTLEVRATPPAASRNFRTIRVEVWNAANTVQLDESQFGGGVWTWSPTRNREMTAAAGGSGATTSVTVRLYAVSWGNVDSDVVTLTATSAAPPTPSGLTHTWAGDTGTAAAMLRITWTAVTGLTGRLSIDGSTAGRTALASGAYEYPLATNASEHSGTPDPVLALSLVFENGLGQVSAAPATATATNAAPPATSVTAQGAFSTYSISITRSTAQDLRDYRVRVYRDSALVATFMTVELDPVITAANGNGSYQVDVTAYDVFGQAGTPSALSAPATLEDPAAFAAALRSGARYRDSLGADPDTLKTALADGNRTSGGIAYSGAGVWRSTDVYWEALERFQPVLITATAGVGYLAVCSDAVPTGSSTWRWFAGPLLADGVTLTEVASQAAAQAAALSLPTSATGRWDLPATIPGRTVRLWSRDATTIREFYAERVVEGDLVRAGSIKTLHLAALAVTADKIFVANLAAIKAELGLVTLGTGGGLWQGSGTFASPTTGLKIWNDAGVGRLATYSGGTVQVQIDSNGALKAGAGAVTLNGSGLQISTLEGAGAAAFQWKRSGGEVTAEQFSLASTGTSSTQLSTRSIGTATLPRAVWIAEATGNPSGVARLTLDSGNSGGTNEARLATGVSSFALGTTAAALNVSLSISGGLTVGAPSVGAGVGSIRAQGYIVAEDTMEATTQLGVSGSGVTNTRAVLNASLASYGRLGVYTADETSRKPLLIHTNGVGFNIVPESNVGVIIGGQGTTSGTYALAVRSSVGTGLFYTRDDGYSWNLGTMSVGGLDNRSDARLKSDIAPIGDRLARALALVPRQWSWTNDPTGRTRYGLIAQEAELVAPELVSEGQPGPGEKLRPGERGVLSIDLGSYVGIVHGGLHGLNDLVQQLVAQIQQLTARIDALEAA